MPTNHLATAIILCCFISSLRASVPIEVMTRNGLPTLAPMLQKTTPSVVNIGTYTNVEVRNPLMEDPFFRRFFSIPNQRRYRRTQSAGSGVIVDSKQGYIVTNHHVVKNADEIKITLADGRELTAEHVGSDSQVDLSVLRVDPESLSEIKFADSSDLSVGDYVVAIGSPFGLSQTVTSGIVSALGRSGLGIEGYEDFIQTDASINPGNSGGALVDLNGHLVGINTAIVAPNGGNVGIGFAIPSNLVSAIMTQLIQGGEVRRGYLGLTVQLLNRDLAEAFGTSISEGVVIVDVEVGSSADRQGLRVGDIITRVGERSISKISDFHSQAATMFVGDNIELEIARNGQTKVVAFIIEENSVENVLGERISELLIGVLLQNFNNRQEDMLGNGVLVTDIELGSRAHRFGLKAGDIVVAANRREVRNISDLRDATTKDINRLSLRVYRSGRFGVVTIF